MGEIICTERASVLEKGIFSLWKKDRNDTGINLAFGFKVENLDRSRLERAVNQIVARHPRLRSTFFEKDGVVFRNTLDSARVSIEDFSSDNLRDFIRPFNLCEGPLLRIALRPDGSTVLFDISHIVTDGFSMAVFFSELDAFYSSGKVGYEPQQIPPENETELLENTSYWAKSFKTEFKNLLLPRDKNGNLSYGGSGSSLVHKIGRRMTEKVLERCRSLSITPFVFYFSAFLLFLSRECGSDDVVTVTNLSCRSGKSIRAIGLLATLAPVRVSVDEKMPGDEFLRKMNLLVKEYLVHQRYDNEKLLSDLGFSDMRDFSRTIFTYEHEKIADIRLDGKKCDYVPIPSLHSSNDLSLCFFPFKTESRLLVIFRVDLFSHARARRFARHYVDAIQSLLEGEL